MRKEAGQEGGKKSFSVEFGYVDPGSLKGVTMLQPVNVKTILVFGKDIEI